MSQDDVIFVTVDSDIIKVVVKDAPDTTIVAKDAPDVIVLAAGNVGADGPQGEVGPVGPAGPQGPQGSTGPASTVPGPAGPQGPKGDPGAASTVPGPQGPKGDTGNTGATGAVGAAGAAGATGATGPGVPVGGATGQALVKKTAADFDTQWATPASGASSELDYVQTVTDFPVSATTEAAAQTYLTGNGFVSDGSPVKVELMIPGLDNGNANKWFAFVLFDGATPVGTFLRVGTLGSNNVVNNSEAYGQTKYTPAVGTRTLSVKVWATSSGGVLKAGVGGVGVPTQAYFSISKAPTIGLTGPQGPQGLPGGSGYQVWPVPGLRMLDLLLF